MHQVYFINRCYISFLHIGMENRDGYGKIITYNWACFSALKAGKLLVFAEKRDHGLVIGLGMEWKDLPGIAVN